MVVFHHAYPVLSHLSAPLLGGAKIGTLAVSHSCLRDWLSHPLLPACSLPGQWDVDSRRPCPLPAPGVCSRDGGCDLAPSAAGRCRTLSSRRLWFVRRSYSLPRGPPVLSRSDELHFCRSCDRRLLLSCSGWACWSHRSPPAPRHSDRARGNVFLRDLSHSPPLCDLA